MRHGICTMQRGKTLMRNKQQAHHSRAKTCVVLLLRFFFLFFVIAFQFFQKLGFGLHDSGSVATASRTVPFTFKNNIMSLMTITFD